MFGFFALVLVSIYWVNSGVALFERIIGDGQSALVFLEFAALTLPNVIRLVLPVAAFAATIYVANRMINESELVVMQALGCSPWRLARPVVLFGVLVALPMAALTHYLVPASRAQLAQRQEEIARDLTARVLTEGQFLHPARDITFFTREITDAGEMHDIFLSDARQPSEPTIYTAKRAFLVDGETGLQLVMLDGLAQSLSKADGRLAVTGFSDFTFDIGALLRERRARRPNIETLPTLALLAPTKALIAETGKPRSVFLHEGHARSAHPLMAVAGALIGFGALLSGGFSRFGMGRQVLLAIVLLIAVNFLHNAAGDLARRDASLWPLTYLPPLVGMALGAALVWASSRRRRIRVKVDAEAPA